MFKSEKQGQKIDLQEWVKALSSFKINMHYFTLSVDQVNKAGKTKKKEQSFLEFPAALESNMRAFTFSLAKVFANQNPVA